MAITKYIQINQGDVITIPSVTFGNLPYDTSQIAPFSGAWGYDTGVSNSGSVLNLVQLYDDCMNNSGITNQVFLELSLWRTDEEMSSAYMEALIATIGAACSWLWGSMEEGGYGFIKIGQNVKTVWHQGIVFKTEDNITYYKYEISLGSVSYGGNLDRDHLSDTVITCIDKGEDMFPEIVLWASNKTYLGKNRYYLLNDGIVPDHYWTAIEADPASVYAGDASHSWALLTGSFPYRPWHVDNEHLRNTTSATFSSFSMIGGWAGREVSEEGDPFEDTTGDSDTGGNGDWNGSSESTPPSDVEDIEDDAINSGFVTLYKATKPQIQSFNDWLWTNITDSLSQQIKRILANPLEGILFIATTHLAPPTSQGTSEIKFCGIGSGVYSLTIPRQFSKYDCGNLQFKTIDGSYSETIIGDTDTFLDYQPYSKAEIYLPSIGYRELDINDLIGSTVSLCYQVDWVSGACIAQLTMNRSKRKDGDAALDTNTLYEFQGNIYTNIPISSSDWKSFYGNMLSVGGGLASALSGNIGAAAAQTASSVATQQISVQKSGNVAASYGYMGQQDIYVYITRPNPAIPINYKGFKGYTKNQRYVIGQLHGYTEVEEDSIWFDGIDGITEDEALLLKEIFSSGVYLNW